MSIAQFAEPPVAAIAESCAGTFGDTWERDGRRHVWRCGDHLLGVDERDWTSWTLARRSSDPSALPGSVVVIAEGGTPPPGYEGDFYCDLETHPYVIENDLEVPRGGLDTFLDYAQEMCERAVLARRPHVGRTFAELTAEAPAEIDWLIPGLLAPGWTTKIAAREKTGKGTHCFYLVGKLERGEDSVYGPSRRATTLVVTEEPVESICEKAEAFGLERSGVVYGYELGGTDWPEQAAAIVQLAMDGRHSVIYLDNFSRRAGVEDENGVELGRALELIADECRANRIALIVDHHHKKGKDGPLDKSRGGTAFAGATDVNLEMFRSPERDPHTRRRRLVATGRFRATNWVRIVELTEDGTDYVPADGPEAAPDSPTRLADVALVQLQMHGPMTAKEYAKWAGVSRETGRRRLDALVDDGRALRDREGSANTAYVYRAAP